MKYPIPADALDDRLAWTGTSGSGKTYNAGAGVEQLLTSGARVIIIDPLDVWWGLRLAPDGQKPSRFKPVIFGGPRGDLPLNERSGVLLGETCARMRESCIVSLADFKSTASERRFMLDFLGALYRHATGEPVHLVIDEADLWAPQVILDRDGDAAKLLGQMQTIVRRGRVKGFIPWLITQRPAEISKGVLSQADGLLAFKLTSSQDRDAIGGWIKGQADAEVGKAILASLPGLPLGQGVVWVPGRGILETATFPTKATFDSSRTPKRGEVLQAAVLKPLDLGALKERLVAVEEEAKANDPKALKAEVARLTGEIAQLRKSTPAADPEALKAAEVRGWAEGWRQARAAAIDALSVLDRPFTEVTAPPARTVQVVLAEPLKSPPRPAPAPAPAAAATQPPATGDPALSGPQRTVLKSLAWWAAMGQDTPSRNQVAVICGWSTNSSNIRDRLSDLSRLGMIERPQPGQVRMTAAGRAAAPAPDTGQTLHDSVRAILSGPQRQVFDALLKAGEPMHRDAIAEAVGWSTNSSNIRDRLSDLARLEIIERPSPGVIALQAWVNQ